MVCNCMTKIINYFLNFSTALILFCSFIPASRRQSLHIASNTILLIDVVFEVAHILFLCVQIDAGIGYLMDAIEVHKLSVNLVLLSDHGMLNVPPQHNIRMENLLPPDSYFTSGSSPLLQIHPRGGRACKLVCFIKV